MTEQPQTMEELVTSVRRTREESPYFIISTLYGSLPEQLPTNVRNIFRSALNQSLSTTLALDEVKPGQTLITSAQTDVWYVQNDPQGAFQNLHNLLINIAARTR